MSCPNERLRAAEWALPGYLALAAKARADLEAAERRVHECRLEIEMAKKVKEASMPRRRGLLSPIRRCG